MASGEKAGQSIAKNISKLQGSAVGKELGIAEAKLWAAVRGEFQGYDQGYALGLASVEDINLGMQEGKDKGKADAIITAQSQFRPQYFEEALVLEFKKPLEGEANKMMRFELEELQNFNEVAAVSPLTSAEISRSDALSTPLDASIISFNKDVKVLKDKVIILSNPNVVYVAPTAVPYGTPVCTAIYKNLAVYKKACEDSYRNSFSDSFLTTTRSTFNNLYTDLYKVEADGSTLQAREAHYPAELISSTEVSSAHGQKLGKADIYKQKFTTSYKETYAVELPLAKEVAKINAEDDLLKALETRGLLTLGKSKITAEDFRGSEELIFSSQVKNISKVAFNGPVLLRITESQNVELAAKTIVLNSSKAQGFTSFSPIKGKINPAAKTGDKIVIRGTVDLPGDVYKPQRQETFEIIQVLAANPTHALTLDYLKNPDIRGLFRYNIHSLKANIKPMAEDIADGYQVTLKAIGENAELIDLKNTSAATGALRQNEQKEVKFTYTFDKSAKNKTITLELTIIYAGKVIKKETIVLKPG